jgi:2-polyprenyl-3-methyl-5-hydroxy-6-metoxy-1,4-benzoquinol methylase
MTKHVDGMQTVQWTPEVVQRFWDHESQHPERYFTFQVGAELVRHLRRYLSARSNVLDFGCGRGHLVRHLLRRGCAVTGLDFSPESLSAVRAEYGKAERFRGAFLPGDILQTGATFERILCVEVFEHLDDAMLSETLSLIMNLLDEKGLLLITVPNREDLSASILRCPQCGVTYHRYQHVRSWDAVSMTHAVSAVGLEVVDCHTTDFAGVRGLGSLRSVARAILQLVGGKRERANLVCIAQKRAGKAGV